MFKNIMSKLVAAARSSTRQVPRPARAQAGCTIEAMEERLLMAIVAVNGGGNTPNGEAQGVPLILPATYALMVTR